MYNDGSEDGDILQLGEAIRNGDLKKVKSFLEENGVEFTLNVMFCFEVYAQRLAMYREDEFLPSTMEPVPIKVTPLQLAVLCKRSQLLEYFLSSATPSIGMHELNNILSIKSKIQFHKGIQNYVDRDQALQVCMDFEPWNWNLVDLNTTSRGHPYFIWQLGLMPNVSKYWYTS